MLVSTTDSIAGKKIVKVLGEVHARNNPFGLGLDAAKNAKNYLIKEAEKLGANAIIGFQSQREQYRSGVSKNHRGRIRWVYYSIGTAVIIEDEIGTDDAVPATTQTTQTTAQPNFCPQCGSNLQASAKFCMQCGHKI